MRANKEKNVPLYVYVPGPLRAKFEKMAESQDLTLSALARRMMEQYMTQSKKPKAS